MNRNPNNMGGQFELFAQLSGTSIRDTQGRLVGRVTDFIVDVSEARLAYLSIALHPFNGGDGKSSVTVPWSIVSLDRGTDGGLRVAVRRQTLMRMANAIK